MPWCQKCKMEYRSGITECADCHIPLTEELVSEVSLILLAQLEKEEQAEKFIEFLHYSKIYSPSLKWNNEENLWDISVSEEDMKDAKKCFSAFYTAEKESANALESSEDNKLHAVSEEMNKREMNTKILQSEGPSSTYVKQKDRYENFHSSGYTFVFVGLACLIYVMLNVFGILTFMTSTFQNICVGILSIIFVLIGISSFRKAKSIHADVGAEESMYKDLEQWLTSNITDDILSQMEDSSLPAEVNYFHKAEQIKEHLFKEFDQVYESIPDTMLDELIENHLNR